jgi:hypothetical protein
MTETNKIQYLPFHAINEFMRDDFRLTVLNEVFTNLEKFEKDQVMRINRLFAKGVQIPGFRNSSLAPLVVKVKYSASLFEKSPEFVALVLNCWSQLRNSLKEAIWKLLDNKNWKPLPIDADRSLLPGFLATWPKGDTFEVLIKGLLENNPEIVESDDNISLMVVWVGNKLPYGLYEEEEN